MVITSRKITKIVKIVQESTSVADAVKKLFSSDSDIQTLITSANTIGSQFVRQKYTATRVALGTTGLMMSVVGLSKALKDKEFTLEDVAASAAVVGGLLSRIPLPVTQGVGRWFNLVALAPVFLQLADGFADRLKLAFNRLYLRASRLFPHQDPLALDLDGDAIKTGAGWVDAGKGLPILASNGVCRQFIKPLTLIAITQKLSEGSGGAAVGNLRTGRDPGRSILFPVLFAVLALFGLTSCDLSNQPKLPKPRFKTPINLSHKGVVADFDIRVTWHRIYLFDIRFEYPEEDQAERERVRKLVGGYGRDKDNNLIEPGILTPVKLTIFKKQKQGELMIYQKIIKDPETYAGGSGSFAKHIGRCDLKRGKYRFVLESLAQPQEYASIPTNFIVTFSGILEARLIFINVDRSKSCPQ